MKLILLSSFVLILTACSSDSEPGNQNIPDEYSSVWIAPYVKADLLKTTSSHATHEDCEKFSSESGYTVPALKFNLSGVISNVNINTDGITPAKNPFFGVIHSDETFTFHESSIPEFMRHFHFDIRRFTYEKNEQTNLYQARFIYSSPSGARIHYLYIESSEESLLMLHSKLIENCG